MSVLWCDARLRTRIAFVAVVSLQLAAIWNHVAWGDEIQAAILARDSNTLADWYWNFRYEGHPPLWHLYLKLWLLAGLDPLSALKAAASSLSLLVMGLIYFASPFTLPLKILISLSEPVLFQFGVVSRSYTLGMALLFTAAALWRARGGWLVIPALAGVSAQFVFIAAMLVLVRIRDQLAWRTCAALVVVASVASVLLSRPARDYAFARVERSEEGYAILLTTVMQAGQLVTSQFPIELVELYFSPLLGVLLLIATIVLLPLVLVRVLRADPLWGWLIGAFFAFTAALSTLLYSLSYRHFALIMLLAVTAWWLAWPRYKSPSRTRTFWLMALVGSGLAKIAIDLILPYSNAQATGEWMRQHQTEGSVVIVLPMELGMELAPHVRSTYRLGGDCVQTFTVFRAPDVDLPREAPYEGGKLKILTPEELSASLKIVARRNGGAALVVADNDWANALIDLGDPSVKLRAIMDRTRRWIHARFIFDVLDHAEEGLPPPPCSTRPASP